MFNKVLVKDVRFDSVPLPIENGEAQFSLERCDNDLHDLNNNFGQENFNFELAMATVKSLSQ